MPRNAKPTEPEAAPVEAVPESPAKPERGAKRAAVAAALKKYKDKPPKEIAEIVTAQGVPTTAGQVSNIKSILASKKAKAKAKAAPADEPEAAPALPKDAISVALLQKAKSLAKQLGGIKEAKAAIDALAQILD